MTWFRIDDQFHSHQRVAEAGNAAIGLWARAGAWSMDHLTDGFIPVSIAKTLGSPAQIKALVRTGLWLEVEGGFMFFRWAEGADGTKRQETRAEAEARKIGARERTQRWRRGRAESKAVGDLPGDDAVTPGDGDGDASRDALVRSPSSSSSSSSPPSEVGADKPPSAPRRRGTRIPDPFVVTGEMRAWAAREVPGLSVDRVTVRFVDYWRGVSGARAAKVDWLATWRNWLREDFEKNPPKPASGPAPFVPKPFTYGDAS